MKRGPIFRLVKPSTAGSGGGSSGGNSTSAPNSSLQLKRPPAQPMPGPIPGPRPRRDRRRWDYREPEINIIDYQPLFVNQTFQMLPPDPPAAIVTAAAPLPAQASQSPAQIPKIYYLSIIIVLVLLAIFLKL